MIDWKTLDSLVLYEQLKINSQKKDQVLLKHSNRCSISHMAKEKLDESDIPPGDKDYYILDVVAYKDLARFIAEDTGVIHQSPQILVFRDGKVIYNASHWAIEMSEIEAH